MKTELTKTDNSSWLIEIANDGTATATAQGNNTRNLTMYNTSNSGLFSCYISGQKDISIYKKTINY